MNDADRPLVSFVLIAYRAEKSIRAAVEGAFKQTYTPLEIILSDDCSPDHTYEIICEMAAAYRGPHQIKTNRNDRNLGIGAHLNRCMELARGELIVVGAGDDVSLPERTEAIVKAWGDSGRKACSIYSDTMMVDEQGHELGVNRYPPANPAKVLSLLDLVRRNKVGVMGCSHAWHRSVFDRFGPLNEDVVNEDAVIPLRSRLLGTVAYLPHPLVRQCMSAGSVTRPLQDRAVIEHVKMRRAVRAQNKLSAYRQWLTDLAKWPETPGGCAGLIEAMRSRAEFDWAMQQSGFRLRWRAFLNAMRQPRNISHVLHWYPICSFSFIYSLWIRRKAFLDRRRQR